MFVIALPLASNPQEVKPVIRSTDIQALIQALGAESVTTSEGQMGWKEGSRFAEYVHYTQVESPIANAGSVEEWQAQATEAFGHFEVVHKDWEGYKAQVLANLEANYQESLKVGTTVEEWQAHAEREWNEKVGSVEEIQPIAEEVQTESEELAGDKSDGVMVQPANDESGAQAASASQA